MNIHLLRSSEIDAGKFFNVTDYLARFPGPVNFLTSEQPAEIPAEDLFTEEWPADKFFWQDNLLAGEVCMALSEPLVVRWADLFRQCRLFREERALPAADPVVLLTGHRNEKNWFSAGAPDGRMDFFIHADMWEWYVDGDERYPIAYELMALPLWIGMFGSFDGLLDNMHHDTRGCMNDFCQNKRDIGFKLRSADICPECLETIRKRRIDPLLVRQVFRVFDDIRSQLLFRERYKFTRQPSAMAITGRRKRIHLTDLGNLEIRMTPLEKTVYLFFLNHPEGVEFSYMPDHYREIRGIYGQVSNSGVLALLENRAHALCANQDDCLSQVISRIRNKFLAALGEEMAQPYLISGEPGQKRSISLDRSLVTFG